MIVFGPLWFVLLMLFLFGVFGGKSKEEKWLEQKQTDNIRTMMAAEQGLTLRQYDRRGALGRALVGLVALCLIGWVWSAVSGQVASAGREDSTDTGRPASAETSGALTGPPHDPPYAEQVRISERLRHARERDAAVRKAAGY